MFSQSYNIQFNSQLYLWLYGFHITSLLIACLLSLPIWQKAILLTMVLISFWRVFLQHSYQKKIWLVQYQKASQQWSINQTRQAYDLLLYKSYHSRWLICLCLNGMKPILLSRTMLSACDWAALRRTLHLYPTK